MAERRRNRVSRERLDRLTTLDASNLRVEAQGVPMHVAALAVLDGEPICDASGNVDLEAIRAHVERRTHAAPRLRQVLRETPLGAGAPAWVDDPAFDIADHVRTRGLPEPGDEEALLRVCSALNEPALPRSRPLWELWLLTGRDDGTVGLLIRLHHVVADGVSALELLGALFDLTADEVAADSPAVAPRPAPSTAEVYADALGGLGDALRRAGSALRRPKQVALGVALRLRQVGGVARSGRAPRVSLNRPVGPHRRVMLVRADLAAAKAVAHAHGGKVNDVVLAAVGGGARRLLEARGELTPDLVLRVSVAASLRGPGQSTGGNQVGVRIVPVPVGEPDAVRRLEHVVRATVAQRSEPPLQPSGRLMQRWMVRVMSRQRVVNLLVSNLPGPPIPVYFHGARVRELFQVGVVQGNIGISVGVLSYAGRLGFDVVADSRANPDAALFANGMAEALAELGAV